MATTEIIQFAILSSAQETILQPAITALANLNTSIDFTLGTQIQEKSTLQLTVEWTAESNTTIPQTLHPLLGTPTAQLHLPIPVFSSPNPATSKIVEHVQSFFPLSRCTPAFQAQVEADFLKFESIYNPNDSVTPLGKLAYGWVDGEQDHVDLKGEKARSFLVCRGWESMEAFEKALKSPEFERAIPILYDWGTPFKMWHVETQYRSNVEGGA